MQYLSRRAFVKRSACAAGAGLILPSWLRNRSDLAIGFQTWVVREPLNKDFPGTLAKMAGYGYETLEMCSPAGYAKYGFGALHEMPVADLRSGITDAGMTCLSCHFTPQELETDLAASIEFAHAFGLEQMVVSSPGIRADADMKAWEKAVDKINEWGATVTESGLTFAYHNHNFEFEKVNGRLIYDILLQGLDPSVVKMQFQVWAIIDGYKAADYFRAHEGRYISAHLSDWSGKDEEQVPIGSGTVDWKDFFEAGKIGGLQNVYVEMGEQTLAPSAAYLQGLRAG